MKKVLSLFPVLSFGLTKCSNDDIGYSSNNISSSSLANSLYLRDSSNTVYNVDWEVSGTRLQVFPFVNSNIIQTNTVNNLYLKGQISSLGGNRLSNTCLLYTSLSLKSLRGLSAAKGYMADWSRISL